MGVLPVIFLFFRALVTSRASLAAENLALRQQLAILPRYRPTRNSRPLAQARLQILLALEVATWRSWPPKNRCRNPQDDSPDVSGKSPLGNTANSIGTPTAWLRSVTTNHRQIQISPSQATVTNVANFP